MKRVLKVFLIWLLGMGILATLDWLSVGTFLTLTFVLVVGALPSGLRNADPRTIELWRASNKYRNDFSKF